MDWDEKIKKWESFNDLTFFWGNPSYMSFSPGVFFFTIIIILGLSNFLGNNIDKRFNEKVNVVKLNENSSPNFNIKINDNKEILSSIESQKQIDLNKNKEILSSLEKQRNTNNEMIVEIKKQQQINEEMIVKIKKQQKEIEDIMLSMKDR